MKYDKMTFNELMEEYFKKFNTSMPISCVDEDMIIKALKQGIPIKSKDI